MCDKGEECNFAECEVCTLCAPGTFKSARSTEPCQACPPNTYRMLPGARELVNCQDCLPKSGTKGQKGQTHWKSCLCDDIFYRLVYDIITDECQVCPPGLTCYGDESMTKVVNESVWQIQGPIFKLDTCPYGMAVYNGNDGVFNEELQQCDMCDKGAECTTPPCTTCVQCAPGKFKSAKSTESCQLCPANTYREDPGARELGDCQDCVAGSNTGGNKAQTSWRNCLCDKAYYKIISNVPSDACYECPPGLTCDGDDTVDIVELPSGKIEGVEKGNWTANGPIFRLQSCPFGYQIYNEWMASSSLSYKSVCRATKAWNALPHRVLSAPHVLLAFTNQ